MSRILGIELRRSAALGAGLATMLIGTLLLFFAEEIEFEAGWLQLAMSQRLYLGLLWPLALAAGAWQARREDRAKVAELFASTPRPRAQRSAPTLAALAIGVVCGYLLMGVAGGAWIIGTARYLPMSVFAVTAVGLLSLIGAVWVGLGIGRMVPSPATAPALGVAGLALLLTIPMMLRLPFLPQHQGWIATVLSPIYEMNMPTDYQAVPGRASAAQAIWLIGLALAGLMLVTLSSRAARVAALLPLVLGGALAMTVMPHTDRVISRATDPVAKELVCAEDAPQVCVSRIHSGLLSEVTPAAKEALTVLAKLPDAPTRVHDDTSTYLPDVYPQWNKDTVLFTLEVGNDGHVRDKENLAASIVAEAFSGPPGCEKNPIGVERMAAAYWLIGREPVEPDSDYVDYVAEAKELWRDLGQLPRAEADKRVAALHKAAQKCAVGENSLSTGKP
ncbi:hypothetical protein Asp14428_39780 [Actinoplanes sp. NBRC 14428]|uniref:Uncharacterized protein n=1 Tax=Pseudosporangium ferrugineum TaxID=439699 RepID=A0A2T0RMC3_9ACTN|nr:hypothetical protein [Pseudosporangium ferrugineum]PRY22346.1 hypothetical protein CLV70_11750 [Pseudosporangium ferrugineum]BCJ52503.1 hypothetical protein Asp14428_39780 [Actinoplanes sp. NBRC 14428]